jgi:hypothetical protein
VGSQRDAYSGTGGRAQPAKRAQYSRRQLLVFVMHFASLLLQLRVLRLGYLQDGDVGVGVFPESKISH